MPGAVRDWVQRVIISLGDQTAVDDDHPLPMKITGTASDITLTGNLVVDTLGALDNAKVVDPDAASATLPALSRGQLKQLVDILAALTRAIASTTAGQTGPLVQGAAATDAPTLTTGKSYPIPLSGTGMVRTLDAGAIAGLASILAKLTADPATETSLAALLAAAATETTMAAVLAKIIAAPATEAKQDSIASKLDDVITALGVANGHLAALETGLPYHA